MTNPYMILGLSNDATNEEIRQEYKRKALKYHPDKIKDEIKRKKYETKFKLIKEAYEEIMKQRQQKQVQVHEMSPLTTMFQDMFQRMNDFDTMDKNFENRIQNLHKTFNTIDVNQSNKGNFYSKRVFYSNINGKKIKKVEENINGQIHQYEEYDDRQPNNVHQLKKN